MNDPLQTPHGGQEEADRLFLALVRIAMGNRRELPASPSAAQWQYLFLQARRQTVVGVLYAALERLPNEQRPPRQLLLRWFAEAELTRRLNARTNRRAAEAHRFFLKQGFRNVIVKGQAVARLYPDPALRTPGDIDIWLEGGRGKILRWAAERGPIEGLTYCHIHFPLFADTEVEAHFTPSYLHDPYANRRLQQWFRETASEQFDHEAELPGGAGSIAVPTPPFDRVFILLHIYKHLFGEGVGMRQLMDYYHVLRQGCTAAKHEDTRRLLKRFGMTRFAGAVAWMMNEVFGLDERFLVVPPDEKEGRFLLAEVMAGGNFGKYDSRADRSRHDELIPRVLMSLRRNRRFAGSYPREIFWNPLFRTAAYLRVRWWRRQL